MSKFRVERDSMGEMEVPDTSLYGATTKRALLNFPISGTVMPRPFIEALILIKLCAAEANHTLGLLAREKMLAIQKAAIEINAMDDVAFNEHFPIDVFQTGSGTSSNMNVNEVIGNVCKRDGMAIHPNDDINMSQSSNDCVPTAIAISAVRETRNSLLNNLETLEAIIEKKGWLLSGAVTTGRTHLMDAMPVTYQQILQAWQAQITRGRMRIEQSLIRLQHLPQGGTAVGTGINAHTEFASLFNTLLSEKTATAFSPMETKFEGISAIDGVVELSGHCNVLAVSLMKIANDLRWMNSGPLAGLGEIALPALQPGSSIMPGKINPVIPEATAMVCAQVMGLHTAITIAGQSGNFQLNVMLPLAAFNILTEIKILASSALLLGEKAIADFSVNQDSINESLYSNPILVTALNTVVGYEKGAAIAKRAYREKRSVLEVAKEDTDLDEATLQQLLNPLSLTKGGIP